jgi:hypothetical protein
MGLRETHPARRASRLARRLIARGASPLMAESYGQLLSWPGSDPAIQTGYAVDVSKMTAHCEATKMNGSLPRRSLNSGLVNGGASELFPVIVW